MPSAAQKLVLSSPRLLPPSPIHLSTWRDGWRVLIAIVKARGYRSSDGPLKRQQRSYPLIPVSVSSAAKFSADLLPSATACAALNGSMRPTAATSSVSRVERMKLVREFRCTSLQGIAATSYQ